MARTHRKTVQKMVRKTRIDRDRDDAGVTHVKPDILGYEVKWSLGSIITNNVRWGDGIPAELFKNHKEWGCKSAVFNMSANLEYSAVATVLEKVSFHSFQRKDNSKECLNYHAIFLISLASKVMLKILQAKHQHYMNWELPDVQTGFRKSRGPRDQIVWS